MKGKTRRVMVFGTFDILHEGHRSLFRQAKRHGDELLVVVARDDTVKDVKGRETLFDQEERLALVGSEPLVDKVLLGHPEDRYALIEKYEPDVLCLGYDQEMFTERLKEKLAERGLNPEIVRAEGYKPEQYKSSILRKKMRRKQAPDT